MKNSTVEPPDFGAARLFAVVLVTVMVIAGTFAQYASASPELIPSTKQKVTWTSGSSKLVGGSDSVTCEKDAGAGEITSATSISDLLVHFLGCSSSSTEGKNCSVKSVGSSSEGLIITGTLHGVVGLLLPAPAIGLLLLPNSGKTVVELAGNACTPSTKVTGNVAGLLEPINESQTTGKVVFGLQKGKECAADIDTPSGLVKPELEAYGATAALETEEAASYEKAVEVKE
jgi:hypothetical protein